MNFWHFVHPCARPLISQISKICEIPLPPLLFLPFPARLTLNLTIKQRQSIHMFPLGIHRRMDIPIQSNLNLRVPQKLAETLDISAALDAVGGKGMSEYMKIFVLQAGFCDDPFKMVLHGSGIRRLMATEYIFLAVPESDQQFQGRDTQRNLPPGILTFGIRLCQYGFSPLSLHIEPLDGPADHHQPVLKIDIRPFQSAQFSKSEPRVQTQEHCHFKAVRLTAKG